MSQDQRLVGELTEDEGDALMQSQQSETMLAMRLAQLELDKRAIMDQLSGLLNSRRALMKSIANRMQIPDQVEWNIHRTGEGKLNVVLVGVEIPTRTE